MKDELEFPLDRLWAIQMESPDKAYHVFMLFCLNCLRSIDHEFSEQLTRMLDDACTYWKVEDRSDVLLLRLGSYEQELNSLIFKDKAVDRTSLQHYPLEKFITLVLSPEVDMEYFDYYVDWVYVLGNSLGLSNKKLDFQLGEALEEINLIW